MHRHKDSSRLVGLGLQVGESGGDGRGELGKSKVVISVRLSLGDSVEVVDLSSLLLIKSWPEEKSKGDQVQKSSSAEPVSDGSADVEVESKSESKEVVSAVKDVSEQVDGGVGNVEDGVHVLLSSLSRDVELDILEPFLEGVLDSLSLKPRGLHDDII